MTLCRFVRPHKSFFLARRAQVFLWRLYPSELTYR